jgi:hypothetical protein
MPKLNALAVGLEVLVAPLEPPAMLVRLALPALAVLVELAATGDLVVEVELIPC